MTRFRTAAPLVRAAVCAFAAAVLPCAADAAEPASEFNVVLTQRVWVATWDQALNDLQITGFDAATGRPTVRAAYQKNVSRRSIPISALGLRYGRWTGTVARFGTQRFDGNDSYIEPYVRRDETDVSLGYQVLPGLSLAIIRKSGTVSLTQTQAASELTGGDGPIKATGNLIGLSASAPLTDSLLVYGNMAYGPGKVADPQGQFQSLKGRYTLAEFGLAYRHSFAQTTLGIQALSLQAGYRTQVLSYPGFVPSDFDALPVQYTITSSKARSVTDGFVLSVSLIF
ncbi:MAG: hypothetical protein U1F56_07810 [Rubrivivax sp.]